MSRRLRILYACGPGNVVESYRRWKAGEDLLSETSRTYSGQFFDFCRAGGHFAYAVSSFGAPDELIDGAFTVENRPKRPPGGGIRYHLSQALYAASIMLTALRWRADALVVDSGTTHWALLGPLKLAGVRIVGSLHNVPWPNGCRPKGGAKGLILASEAWFWRRVADAMLSVSPECERQVRELAGRLAALAVQHRAQYRRGHFAAVPPPPPVGEAPLRLMFAGRIERNKGALDLVEVARLLEAGRPGRVRFDICGGGPALGELEAAIRRHDLGAVLRTHGRLERPELLERYAESHAVIVPTRSDFCEGMPMVCAEAVLCGRPVITSRLANAEDVLPGAIELARPDDPASYAEAILRLLDEPGRYERLRAGCAAAQEQFYDSRYSLTSALATVLAEAGRGASLQAQR